MKKLKVVLTLLLVLCCSCCMFACGGGEKNISEVNISGQKENFKEGEEFSVGDLKVSVFYQGDDEEHPLEADDYEVDASNYNKDLAGEYLIYVIPKNQPKELWDGTEGGKDNRVKKTYYAKVDHSWIEDGNGKSHCNCGAQRNVYSDLEDQIKTIEWGNQATFTPGPEGKTYPNAKAPIAGENHVAYDTLVKGQSLKLTLYIDAVKTDSTNAWFTPLMGMRNAGVGMIPREDVWVIATAAGFALPAESNIPSGGSAAATGTATKDSDEWFVYGNGTDWSSHTDLINPTEGGKNSTIDVEYIYGMDDVFMIRHTLHKFDNTTSVYTFSVKVPDASYEIVAYGELCDYTVKSAEFVASRVIDTYTVTKEPDATVQPAGKIFDTTGLNTKATFSDGGSLEGSYNAYAFHDVTPAATTENPNPDPVKTRVNLSSTPLAADFYDFMVEFNGKQAWLTADGNESTAANKETNQKIHVVDTKITGANASVIESGEAKFESPDLTYDYAVTDSKTFEGSYIRLIATGTAVKATTDAQKAVLTSGYEHFIAFKLVTNLATDAFDSVTVGTETKTKAIATKQGTTVDVIVGLQTGFGSFDLSLKKADAEVAKIKIDLGGVNTTLPAASAEITACDFTLDAGGTYTVEYKGLTDVQNLTLATGTARGKVSEIVSKVTGTYTAGTTPTQDKFYRASNTLYIVGITAGADTLTVRYWFAAPELGNLTAAGSTTKVEVRNGDTTLVAANLTYKLAVSEDAIAIGDGVYVKASGNKLQVYAFATTKEIKDGASFAATLNIQHPVPTVDGKEDLTQYVLNYNVGVSIVNGVASWADSNALTAHASSAAKLVALGTPNDATDYDIGYILVANLHLPAIDVRTKDAKAVYYFTANENTAEKQTDAQTFYKVDATNAITPASHEIGSDVYTVLSQVNCLFDGWSAYKGSVDGTVFYYGAVMQEATGEHKWQATATEGVQQCSECLTITNYAHINSNADVKAENVTTAKVVDKNGKALTELTASFEVQNVTSAIGDWGSQTLVTGAGNMIVTLPNLDPWNNSVTRDIMKADDAATPDVDESKEVLYAKLTDATDREKELADKLAEGNCYPADENKMNGANYDALLNCYSFATVTMSVTGGINYYKDGVLVISYPADKVINKGTVGDFVELFLSLASRYGITVNRNSMPLVNFMLIPIEATPKQVTKYYNEYVEKMGKPEAPAFPEYSEEQETPTITATGYTNTAPVWIGNPVKKGGKVTITGNLKSTVHDHNWQVPIVNLFTGSLADSLMRLDGWPLNGEKEKWTIESDPACDGAVDNYSDASKNANADFLALIADCTLVITIDYTKDTEIVVTAEFSEDFVSTFTVKPNEGTALAAEYNIGIGGEGMTYTVSKIERV